MSGFLNKSLTPDFFSVLSKPKILVLNPFIPSDSLKISALFTSLPNKDLPSIFSSLASRFSRGSETASPTDSPSPTSSMTTTGLKLE